MRATPLCSHMPRQSYGLLGGNDPPMGCAHRYHMPPLRGFDQLCAVRSYHLTADLSAETLESTAFVCHSREGGNLFFRFRSFIFYFLPLIRTTMPANYRQVTKCSSNVFAGYKIVNGINLKTCILLNFRKGILNINPGLKHEKTTTAFSFNIIFYRICKFTELDHNRRQPAAKRDIRDYRTRKRCFSVLDCE